MYPPVPACHNELDQILVPVATGYQAYPLLNLLGFSSRKLRSTSGFGLPPLHFITQRGPYQDGETVLDMRLDVRTIQIIVAETLGTRAEFWDRRYDLLDLLRPSRSFDGTVRPLVYRKWLPAGKLQQGSDATATNGSNIVTSPTARFVHWGLEAGQVMTVGDANYRVGSVPNDYTVYLTANYHGATGEQVHWLYRRGWGKRDLYCLLEEGPRFDEGPGASPFYPTGYYEALRFVAHDPVWYGQEQSETWALDVLGDLVFDGEGAWFGATAGSGRWLFEPDFVGESTPVTYWGTVTAKPLIAFTGPMENPTVENTTTGLSIVMDYTVANGETVTIDTLALTVTNQFGVNLLPYTSGDLATFGIEPPPQAPDRRNVIYVSFSGGTAGISAATMTWRNRYIGI